jgi:hypothetical protein
MSDKLQLSELQRDKLLAFISRADTVIGDGPFDPQEEWGDCEIRPAGEIDDGSRTILHAAPKRPVCRTRQGPPI